MFPPPCQMCVPLWCSQYRDCTDPSEGQESALLVDVPLPWGPGASEETLFSLNSAAKGKSGRDGQEMVAGQESLVGLGQECFLGGSREWYLLGFDVSSPHPRNRGWR